MNSKQKALKDLALLTDILSEIDISSLTLQQQIQIKDSLNLTEAIYKSLDHMSEQEDDEEELPPEVNESLLNMESSSFKVMIVDDDPITQKLVKSFLMKNKFQVASYLDPVEALDAVRKENPDLIILDLMMPKMTGYEFLDNLKIYHADIDCKILVGSGKQFVKDRLKSLEKGADDFMDKPYRFKELLLRIQNLLK